MVLALVDEVPALVPRLARNESAQAVMESGVPVIGSEAPINESGSPVIRNENLVNESGDRGNVPGGPGIKDGR